MEIDLNGFRKTSIQIPVIHSYPSYPEKPPFNGVNPFHLNGTSIFGNLHLNPSYTE